MFNSTFRDAHEDHRGTPVGVLPCHRISTAAYKKKIHREKNDILRSDREKNWKSSSN